MEIQSDWFAIAPDGSHLWTGSPDLQTSVESVATRLSSLSGPYSVANTFSDREALIGIPMTPSSPSWAEARRELRGILLAREGPRQSILFAEAKGAFPVGPGHLAVCFERVPNLAYWHLWNTRTDAFKAMKLSINEVGRSPVGKIAVLSEGSVLWISDGQLKVSEGGVQTAVPTSLRLVTVSAVYSVLSGTAALVVVPNNSAEAGLTRGTYVLSEGKLHRLVAGAISIKMLLPGTSRFVVNRTDGQSVIYELSRSHSGRVRAQRVPSPRNYRVTSMSPDGRIALASCIGLKYLTPISAYATRGSRREIDGSPVQTGFLRGEYVWLPIDFVPDSTEWVTQSPP